MSNSGIRIAHINIEVTEPFERGTGNQWLHYWIMARAMLGA